VKAGQGSQPCSRGTEELFSPRQLRAASLPAAWTSYCTLNLFGEGGNWHLQLL